MVVNLIEDIVLNGAEWIQWKGHIHVVNPKIWENCFTVNPKNLGQRLYCCRVYWGM